MPNAALSDVVTVIGCALFVGLSFLLAAYILWDRRRRLSRPRDLEDGQADKRIDDEKHANPTSTDSGDLELDFGPDHDEKINPIEVFGLVPANHVPIKPAGPVDAAEVLIHWPYTETVLQTRLAYKALKLHDLLTVLKLAFNHRGEIRIHATPKAESPIVKGRKLQFWLTRAHELERMDLWAFPAEFGTSEVVLTCDVAEMGRA